MPESVCPGTDGNETPRCVSCDGRYWRMQTTQLELAPDDPMIPQPPRRPRHCWPPRQKCPASVKTIRPKNSSSENPFAIPIRLSIAEGGDAILHSPRFRSQDLEENRNEVAHVCGFTE